jgi:hypothetical protein
MNFYLWPDGEQAILSEGDEKLEQALRRKRTDL